jgi:hypothetical protein
MSENSQILKKNERKSIKENNLKEFDVEQEENGN